MKTWSLFLLCLWPIAALTQIVSGRITGPDGSPLAFVTVVVVESGQGTYTDIDGRYSIAASLNQRLRFSYVGYKMQVVDIEAMQQPTVVLEPAPIALAEAVVEAGVNPADILMQKVIDAKDDNNPENQGSFTYKAYNKLVFTANVDSAIAASTDSSDIRMRKFLEEQHLLLMESVSERTFLGPGRDSEKVLASRFSGLSDPQFVLLGTQLQSFSFYNNEVALLDGRYVSPLNDLAIKKYLFVIEDTTFVDRDSVFVVSFQPRSGKNFNGIKGVLYINSGSWSIRNVLASPVSQNSGIEINIRQKYEQVNGSVWFPVQLNTDLQFATVNVNNSKMIGIGRSYITDIQFEPDIRKRDVSRAVLVLDPLATKQPDEVWNNYRHEALDSKEIKTYQFMDSLSKAEGLDRRMRFFQALSTGKLRLGPVNVDLDRLVRFNDFEGFRLGAGVHTNERISRVFSVGGYVGYGFKDRQLKFGGDLTFNVHPMSNTTAGVRAYRDIYERGGTRPMGKRSSFDESGYLDLFINRMDRMNVVEAFFHTDLVNGLSCEATARSGQLQLQNNVSMVVEKNEVRLFHEIMQFEELELGLRWSFREKIFQMPDRRLVVGTPFPVVSVNAIVGKTEFYSEPYKRIALQVDYTLKTALAGNISVRMSAGQVSGPAPSFRFFSLRGSGVDWSVATPFGFETLRPGTMLPTRFAAFHFRYNLRDLLFKSENFAPQPVIVHNMAVGEFQPENTFSSLVVSAPTKGYFESGLALQSLMKSGFSGLGVGAFYHYGPLSSPYVKDNFTYKLTINFTF